MKPAGKTPVGGQTTWPVAIAASAVASVVVLGLMFWARSTYQVRTLPERVMEWVLLFVPLDLFEEGLRQFGTGAKVLALNGAIVGMAVALITLGALALRGGTRLIIGMSLGLWLGAMVVVMPVTGAGFFATSLLQDVLLTNLSYLGLAVAYATTLLLAQWLTSVRKSRALSAERMTLSRRALIAGLATTGASYALTLWVGRSAGSASSALPLAKIEDLPPVAEAPTTVPVTPTNPPTLTTVVSATPQSSASIAATPVGQPATAVATAGQAVTTALPASPTPVPAQDVPTAVPAKPTPTPVQTTATPRPAVVEVAVPPAPGPKRSLSRDKDGVLTASGRQPGELADLITPIPSFYITTKNAAGDPVLDQSKWRLVVDGEVARPVQLDLKIIYQLPMVEVNKTLECISNLVAKCELVPFGCDLISTATWRGVRLRDVIGLAGGLKTGVRSLAVIAADEFSASIPAEAVDDPDTLLAIEMNGEVLPLEHGFPARLLMPGRFGMKSPKWIVAIRPTRDLHVDWYGQRNWSRDGVVHTMSRIDVPANGQVLPPGVHRIAGIAYAGIRGIQRVDFSVDDGQSWERATFVESAIGRDTWVRWQGTFTLPSSEPIRLMCRAVDGGGRRQTEAFSLAQPNGSTGIHTIEARPEQA